MATAESSSSAPRYAPDDPTLPEPWKGLIDGNTGLLYYWNPETNVTQYEKPVPSIQQPPLPLGPPHAAAASKLNPVLVGQASQPDSIQNLQNQQLMQTQLPQGVLMSSSLHQQPYAQTQVAPQATQQKVAPPGQLQASHLGHTIQQSPSAAPEETTHQKMQQIGQQGQPLLGQMHIEPGKHEIQQPMQQIPMHPGQRAPYQSMPHVQHGQMYPGPQLGTSHGFQFTPQPQPTQFMLHQQSMPQQGPQYSSPQPQHLNQGQHMSQKQDHKVELGPRDTIDYFQGKQVSPSHQHLMQGQQFPHAQEPKTGISHQHGQMQNMPPIGSKMPYEESHLARAKNEHYYNSTKDTNALPHQLPKLAPLPMTRIQQEARTNDFTSQNVPTNLPGSLNGPGGPNLHGVYNHSSGPPHPSNAFARPPLAMTRPSDPIHLSAAEIYRQKHEVTATGEDIPAPFMTFEATGFPPEILQELHFAGFSAPTPIQAQTWPIALRNRDIVAIAKTGSGKTLGYLIPAFIHIGRRRNNPRDGPTVLVLAPTRELATQIQDEAIKFGRSFRVSCTCLYGGAPKGPQLKELERGADIVVATPGRLNDILEMKRIDFRQVSLLVLDEADRMLDMGFEPQIRKIVNEIPPRRQTLMYTATWPKEVRKIASDLLVNPVQVNIGSVDELAANKSITQYVEVVPELEKQRRLEQILRSQERGSKVIIFCSTKKLCDQLTRSLGRNFGAAAIHGDKSQGERDWVLNQFRMGKAPVLVATDVAARGLDIRDIRVVINYDFPTGIEDYVHRIGRTGRAGATGVSYTFFSEHDWKYAPDLVKVLEGANQAVPPQIRDIAARGGPSFGKDRGAMNRYESADGGGGGGGTGRWDSGGRGGMRDGAFGGRGGMRDGGFGGRGGMRDGGFGGRGGTRDGGFGFGGRGGMRDGGGGFGGRGRGRDGGGFGGPSGGRTGWERGGGGPHDRFNNLDARGRGRGRGRGRFDSRRDSSDRSRGKSFSPSPERVRTWDYSRSQSRSRSKSRSRSRGGRGRSRSRSWSRDRSYSRSRSRSRSWSSRSRSPRRSRSRSPRRSRSRSCSHDRYERRPRRPSKFDQMEVPAPAAPESELGKLPMANALPANEPEAAANATVAHVPCVEEGRNTNVAPP